MSHFNVAVITKGIPTEEDIEKALAPYQENNMGDCPKEFLEFHSLSEEYKEEYETGTTERVRLSDGTLVYTWADCLFKEVTKEEYEQAKAAGIETRSSACGSKWEKYSAKRDLAEMGAETVTLPWKEVYPTFEQYLEDWHGAKKDEETNDYGYWENPNRKWDWWMIGGRWRGSLTVREDCENCDSDKYPSEFAGYKCVDSARIKDLAFPSEQKEYEKAKRFWELHVDGEVPKSDEDNELLKGFRYIPDYYKRTYKDKETYAECESTFHTYAVVDKERRWFAKGEMGWFGCSNEAEDQVTAYIRAYKQNVFETADDDDYITIVDCHI